MANSPYNKIGGFSLTLSHWPALYIESFCRKLSNEGASRMKEEEKVGKNCA